MELSEWHRWWKHRGGAGVRRLLMDEWDPIGVRGMPEARDEYDAYVGVVGRMLHEGAGVETIQAYLTELREVRMGFAPSEAGRSRERDVAAQLVEWYANEMTAALSGSSGQPPRRSPSS